MNLWMCEPLSLGKDTVGRQNTCQRIRHLNIWMCRQQRRVDHWVGASSAEASCDRNELVASCCTTTFAGNDVGEVFGRCFRIGLLGLVRWCLYFPNSVGLLLVNTNSDH